MFQRYARYLLVVFASVMLAPAPALAGTGLFGNPGQANLPRHVLDVAIGDLDGDGDLDALFATALFADSTVWLNDGRGIFSATNGSFGNTMHTSAALGDLDGDGDLDAYLGLASANATWFNDGDGNFTFGASAPASTITNDVVLGDLDGDGDLDVYDAAHNEPDRVWLNDGAGTFTDSGQLLSAGAARSAALGDIDGDGDLDVVLGRETGYGAWLNNGSGIFTSTGQLWPLELTFSVALGDIDGDGDLDLVAGNTGADRVFLNNGSGTFNTNASLVFGGGETNRVELGDFDGDGDLDAFLGKDNVTAGAPNEVWFNDGSGAFTDSLQRLGSFRTHSAALGDLDGDGDVDVLSGNLGDFSTVDLVGGSMVWQNAGSGQKAFFITPATGVFPKTHHSDISFALRSAGAKPKGLQIFFNGKNVTKFIINDLILGLLTGGGWSFRFADLVGGPVPSGTHTLRAEVLMSDGSILYDIVTWKILPVTEP